MASLAIIKPGALSEFEKALILITFDRFRRWISRAKKVDRVSLNQFIAAAVAEKILTLRTAAGFFSSAPSASPRISSNTSGEQPR
jgi:hypothetical protein